MRQVKLVPKENLTRNGLIASAVGDSSQKGAEMATISLHGFIPKPIMSKNHILTIAALLACGAAFAAPAPWYLWKSTVDSKTFCSQTSPGDGWVRLQGPFDNGRCVKREPGDGDGRVRKAR